MDATDIVTKLEGTEKPITSGEILMISIEKKGNENATLPIIEKNYELSSGLKKF